MLRPRAAWAGDDARPRLTSQPVAVRLQYGCQSLLDKQLEFEFEIGSGTGIRTLNLAVNSRLLYR